MNNDTINDQFQGGYYFPTKPLKHMSKRYSQQNLKNENQQKNIKKLSNNKS